MIPAPAKGQLCFIAIEVINGYIGDLISAFGLRVE
jgi:hypothetical protein